MQSAAIFLCAENSSQGTEEAAVAQDRNTTYNKHLKTEQSILDYCFLDLRPSPAIPNGKPALCVLKRISHKVSFI
jgi:hypothetical protein